MLSSLFGAYRVPKRCVLHRHMAPWLKLGHPSLYEHSRYIGCIPCCIPSKLEIEGEPVNLL